MARKLVFDTYAILALLEDEPGAQTVAEIVSAEEPPQNGNPAV